MDVCTIAAGLGAATVRVERVGDLRRAAELIRHAPGPVVIDVRIDPTIELPKRDRVAAWKNEVDPPRPSSDGGKPQLRLVH
jgi:thiamine pyrophosphate-dependent acetolactate synthase large subunit-like protein